MIYNMKISPRLLPNAVKYVSETKQSQDGEAETNGTGDEIKGGNMMLDMTYTGL